MNEIKKVETKSGRNVFQKIKAVLTVTSLLVAFAITFYGGMYFNAAQQPEKDPKSAILSAIENAIKDTDQQPIIVIKPTQSFIEKAQSTVLFWVEEEERETVTISMDVATEILIGKQPEQPHMAAAMLTGVKNFGKWIGDKTMHGYNWVADKTWR